MKTEQIKAIVELCNTYEEADKMIEKYVGCNSLQEKITYIQTIWSDVKIFHKTDDNLETDYITLLTTIINLKYV